MSVYAIEVARRQPDGTWRWVIGDPFTLGKNVAVSLTRLQVTSAPPDGAVRGDRRAGGSFVGREAVTPLVRRTRAAASAPHPTR